MSSKRLNGVGGGGGGGDTIIKIKFPIEYFKCEICQGVIIDATRISECLHAFCKTCIVTYLEDGQRCPTCDIEIKDKLNCIQPDPKYQRLIYKLLPKLLKEEIDRRQLFYEEQIKLNGNNAKIDELLTKDSIINVKLFGEIHKQNTERYLQCSANTPLRVLLKLLRNKYSIDSHHEIRLRYMDVDLDDEEETLFNLFVCFILNKNDVLELRFEIIRIQK